MKLWLDDTRSAPDGWTWVTTAREAIEELEKHGHEIVAVSLDHDLGAAPGQIFVAGDSPETGHLVAQFIADEMPIRHDVPIRVHSWNPPAGRRMVEVLVWAGYSAVYEPITLKELGL